MQQILKSRQFLHEESLSEMQHWTLDRSDDEIKIEDPKKSMVEKLATAKYSPGFLVFVAVVMIGLKMIIWGMK